MTLNDLITLLCDIRDSINPNDHEKFRVLTYDCIGDDVKELDEEMIQVDFTKMKVSIY